MSAVAASPPESKNTTLRFLGSPPAALVTRAAASWLCPPGELETPMLTLCGSVFSFSARSLPDLIGEFRRDGEDDLLRHQHGQRRHILEADLALAGDGVGDERQGLDADVIAVALMGIDIGDADGAAAAGLVEHRHRLLAQLLLLHHGLQVRPTRSSPPPGALGTTISMGRVGFQSSARAEALPKAIAARGDGHRRPTAQVPSHRHSSRRFSCPGFRNEARRPWWGRRAPRVRSPARSARRQRRISRERRSRGCSP